MEKEINEVIEKYGIVLVSKGRGASRQKGLQTSTNTINDTDLEFIKSNKTEIMKCLEVRKAEKEEAFSKAYNEEAIKELEAEYPDKFRTARETGNDILLNTWFEPYRNNSAEGATRCVDQYVKPDGTIYVIKSRAC